jgi:hypothetical protein
MQIFKYVDAQLRRLADYSAEIAYKSEGKKRETTIDIYQLRRTYGGAIQRQQERKSSPRDGAINRQQTACNESSISMSRNEDQENPDGMF